MRNLDSCRCWRCTLCPCKLRNEFLVNFWNRTILLCIPCTSQNFVKWRIWDGTTYTSIGENTHIMTLKAKYVQLVIFFSLWPNAQHLGECLLQKGCDSAHKSRANTNAPLTWSIVSICLGLFCGIHSKSYGKKKFPVS